MTTLNPIEPHALKQKLDADAWLLFAGLRGWCGMLLLLKTAPWKRASLSS